MVSSQTDHLMLNDGGLAVVVAIVVSQLTELKIDRMHHPLLIRRLGNRWQCEIDCHGFFLSSCALALDVSEAPNGALGP